MEKDDKDSQEYLEYLNELREEMSAKGLTSEELDEISRDKNDQKYWIILNLPIRNPLIWLTNEPIKK